MANVYTTENMLDKQNTNSQLATVAYVDESIKRLKDVITKILNTSINYENHNPELKILPEKEADLSNIPAENIQCDSNHRFITQEDISNIESKISEHDANILIDNLKKELMNVINNKFDFIFSNTNSLDNIKYLINLLNNDDKSKNIIDLINTKATNEELNNHINSINHLNSKDREALDQLSKFIKLGCADWNASKDDPNYIRNKPESFIANGGNSDTVSGYGIESILNHQIENLIIGFESNNYDESEVDIMLHTSKEVDYIFSKIKNGGIYSFKNGIYKFNIIDLNIKNGNIIINGSGNKNTIFNVSNIIIHNNITFKNICFSDCNIIVGNDCQFINCEFIDCDITLSSSINNRIMNNNFKKSLFMFNGLCAYNIITNNIFINTKQPYYSGGSNIILNNICY